MYYLIFILLFLFGCTTSDKVSLRQKSSEKISLEQIDESDHRKKAKELGISYVDYLHLINTQKKSVNKSYPKLRHNNE